MRNLIANNIFIDDFSDLTRLRDSKDVANSLQNSLGLIENAANVFEIINFLVYLLLTVYISLLHFLCCRLFCYIVEFDCPDCFCSFLPLSVRMFDRLASFRHFSERKNTKILFLFNISPVEFLPH